MQVVSPEFNEYAKGDVRPHSWGCRISFDKAYDDTVKFFTLNQSVLDGSDVLGTDTDNPIQAWDYYKYEDYTDRITFMSWDRTFEFPYSIVSARADFELSNTDSYFTPNSSSPLAPYILPKRPVRLLSGFKNIIIPQFVGLTQGMPDIQTPSQTATFTALDFLTQIYDMPIRETIAMQNVRTDQVLANIFQQFGLAPAQYDLAKARNIIPFLFFNQEQVKAGDVIRPLMEAEGGMLWLGEDGIIRFRPRLEQPDTPTYDFTASEIISVGVSSDDAIINSIKFSGEVREVQEYQIVYIKSQGGQNNIIPANTTGIFKAELLDPCLTIVAPQIGNRVAVSWFIATLPNGTEVTANISVTATSLKTNSYEISIRNNNSFSINISQMELWGQPAKIVDTVNKTIDYQPSIDKYEVKQLVIDNNFIQTESQMESLGLTILDEYAEYASILDLEVKGNPAIQLSDIVTVNYKQFVGQYRVIGISCSLKDSKFTQNIKLRAYHPRHWFTLNQSVLNGTDVLAP